MALERTQEELLDDVHQRIRKAKVDGGLVPTKGESSRGARNNKKNERTNERHTRTLFRELVQGGVY